MVVMMMTSLPVMTVVPEGRVGGIAGCKFGPFHRENGRPRIGRFESPTLHRAGPVSHSAPDPPRSSAHPGKHEHPSTAEPEVAAVPDEGVEDVHAQDEQR